MQLMRSLITLTTDFGVSNPYVAQMKGVILSIAPEAEIVDITHAVAPQGVLEGAVVLDDVCRRFPPGTIHVAVVDPGVGTARRSLYAEIAGQRYLCPDNGLLTLVLRRSPADRLVELQNRDYFLPEVSSTFHGRDVFAPVAAHLALGLAPELLGWPLSNPVLLELPQSELSNDQIRGEVLLVDSFGNAITNIERGVLEQLGRLDRLEVRIGSVCIGPVRRTYGDSPSGELIALLDSQGRLEVAVVNGSAAQVLGLQPGMPVEVARQSFEGRRAGGEISS
jgi:S-adenosyl-L-methionine hydrolase (adenosine-forming)